MMIEYPTPVYKLFESVALDSSVGGERYFIPCVQGVLGNSGRSVLGYVVICQNGICERKNIWRCCTCIL